MLLPHHAPARPHPDVLTLVAELVRRGFIVELVTHDCCGEEDVRVHVWDAVTPVTVEVLLAGGCWPTEHWDAVRVDGGGRLLWRGPCRLQPVETLVRFVGDLLTEQSRNALISRYRLLG